MNDDIEETQSQNNQQTNPEPPEFDFASYPQNTLFHDRRGGRDRRAKGGHEAEQIEPISPSVPIERRAKKDRRRRIDPTTFEKQYTVLELEFMNAMQRFKDQSGKSFPSYGEVLKVAAALGYRRVVIEPDEYFEVAEPEEPTLVQPSTVDA
jgi:hypothetical protein